MDEAETEASAAAAETSASFVFITAENIPVRHRDSVRAETVHRLITEETVNKNYRPVEPAADLGVSVVYDKTLVCYVRCVVVRQKQVNINGLRRSWSSYILILILIRSSVKSQRITYIQPLNSSMDAAAASRHHLTLGGLVPLCVKQLPQRRELVTVLYLDMWESQLSSHCPRVGRRDSDPPDVSLAISLAGQLEGGEDS